MDGETHPDGRVSFSDPGGLIARACAGDDLLLELGCGDHKRNPSAIGIDARMCPGVDVIGDAAAVLRALPEASVARIDAEHFLEHLREPMIVLEEAARVVRTGGVVHVEVPHFSSPYYYSDPTHQSFFGLYTIAYTGARTRFRRSVPVYGSSLPFVVEHLRLGFKSARPFYGRHAIKRLIEYVVNLSRWTQEFYEENLCWVIPCYEIRFELRRT